MSICFHVFQQEISEEMLIESAGDYRQAGFEKSDSETSRKSHNLAHSLAPSRNSNSITATLDFPGLYPFFALTSDFTLSSDIPSQGWRSFKLLLKTQ